MPKHEWTSPRVAMFLGLLFGPLGMIYVSASVAGYGLLFGICLVVCFFVLGSTTFFEPLTEWDSTGDAVELTVYLFLFVVLPVSHAIFARYAAIWQNRHATRPGSCRFCGENLNRFAHPPSRCPACGTPLPKLAKRSEPAPTTTAHRE